ncbi:hypothetical protein M135_2871 [Bacteroides fragilis str. S36L5]|uniref:DUF4906 domain-containing protein n=2 Tax=Bacteroides fragilis TaxID=817 RepID=UPI000451B62D|nr:DUF4906 domain-containing protein [Bacteroides fragilis]EYA04232.1 hypothetical protein M126_2824 [Bacteroides fragilis str. S6L3]EYA90540.1 hypothetical protein M135_2871 [Bacteroides fragilis str. S36L5]MCS2986931.1 DUF4906 domain-containing protein [Bacteroides fragilis]UVR46924.1 DUF4906 domain-containing protein [Bacteroides fragilis]UVR69043.1 DUF4906 domain-containing protein [Bacteroides fragilis]
MKHTSKNLWKLPVLVCLLGMAACEERADVVPVDADTKPVEVSLCFGFADDSKNEESQWLAVETRAAAFDVKRLRKPVTRGVPAVPTKLYNLEILQYDRNGNYKAGNSYGTVELGTHLDVTLNVMNDCQLLVVARGNKDAVKTLVGKNLEDTESTKGVKSMDIDASIINQIDPSTADAIDAMPYVLHLEHVNVVTGTDGKAVIQSPEGSYDTRLLLKRLAARLTVSWNYTVSGYELKQVLLQSVPLNYTLVPTADSNGTYPSILDQFHTVEIDMSKGNSYSCWIPANVRGESPAANSDLQRTKANAPKGSSFLNFVAVNTTDPKKKLDYRVYIGGKTSSDFSLNNNTEYSYAVSFSHTGIPTNDKRVTYIDPVPASENNDNPVPTANCFMVAPGGGFCFDPLVYQSDGTEKTNETLKGWCQGGGIVKVKLLWQTKEDGDIGEPVMGIVNSAEDHTNIVDIKRTDGKAVGQNPVTDKGQCRIYCRVAPGTTGGSGVIAAYDSSDKILWSWHVWVTDYHPDATGNVDVQEPLTKRKLKFTYGNHPDQRPMMDRDLGAMAGYAKAPTLDVEKFKAHGFQYQWGRKDPYPSSYSNKPIKTVNLPAKITEPIVGIMSLYGSDGVKFLPFDPSYNGRAGYQMAYRNPLTAYKPSGSQYWFTDDVTSSISGAWATVKTVHDPCPAGWRVAKAEEYYSLFSDKGYNGTLPSYSTNNMNMSNYNTQGADKGFVLRYDETDQSKTTYFRLCGYYADRVFVQIGYFDFIWCCNCAKNGNTYQARHLQLVSTASDQRRGINGINNEGTLSAMLPLRCIQEKD